MSENRFVNLPNDFLVRALPKLVGRVAPDDGFIIRYYGGDPEHIIRIHAVRKINGRCICYDPDGTEVAYRHTKTNGVVVKQSAYEHYIKAYNENTSTKTDINKPLLPIKHQTNTVKTAPPQKTSEKPGSPPLTVVEDLFTYAIVFAIIWGVCFVGVLIINQSRYGWCFESYCIDAAIVKVSIISFILAVPITASVAIRR